MKRFRLLLVLTLALLVAPPLAAQAPAAAPAQPPRAPTAAIEEPKLPDVSDPMLTPVPPSRNVLSSWQQALSLARRDSSSLRIASAQAEQARAQSRQALSAALPNLTGNGNVTRHLLLGEGPINFAVPPVIGTIPDPVMTWQAGLALRVPVFAPQAWHDYGTARSAERAVRLNSKETQRQVAGTVAESIVAVVTAERLSEVSRVSLRSSLSTLELTKRRFRLGAGTALDVVRFEQEVQLARAQLVSSDEAVRRSREALGLALGSPEPWGLTPAIRLDALGREARTSCRQENSVDSRPDVRAARANIEVADRNVSSISWAYLPTVDFVSNLTYLSDRERSPNNEHATWTIGGVLNWTLYDGGLRYGTREFNQQQANIVREQLVLTRRQARVEVVQTTRAVQVAEANLRVSSRNRDLAAESVRLSRIAYTSGAGTSFDLVDTQRRLREAELDLTIKEFEVVRAKVAALLALATCDV